MRVIFYRQREVPGRLAPGEIQSIFAAPDELDDGQGKVGKFLGGGRAAAGQETFKCRRVRCGGKMLLELLRELDDACPALGITQHAA